ncbi:MAG: alpha/beta hydrolase [Lentisphaeraceae bacterium]|nr:alpha/beta hydrolase [Lentisphaeraceae bacterium]
MPIMECNGINIAYEERGSGDPLILIMGLSARGLFWEEHVKEYEKHFRCIIVDNRGAGDSDKPEGSYTTEMMADDIAALIKGLNLGKVHVNGISMGGAIGQHLAIKYPELVRSLVLVSTWAKCDGYALQVFDHFKDMRKTATPHDFMKLLQLWIFAPPFFLSAENRDNLAEGCKDAPEHYMPLHAFLAQSDACMTHDTLATVSQIKCPTLITIGDEDIFTPMKFSVQLNELIEGSEMLVLPGTGHAHHWEDLETFNTKTAQFMLNN